MRRILLTGGGSAGHVMPNMALLPELRKHFDRIVYMGGKGSIEEEVTSKYSLMYYSTSVIKFDRKHLLSNLKIPIILKKGIDEAVEILREVKPQVVFSKGGYAALPACFAAKRLNIPVICHESDRTMGLANRLTSFFAKLIISPYPLKASCPVKTLPLPIRDSLFEGDSFNIRNKYGITKPILLCFGGSLGAVALNEAVLASLKRLTKKYFVIHIVGAKNKIETHSDYLAIKYTDKIEDYYAAAEVVVSRAGAGALSELAALGKRSVIVPLSKKASRGDQIENAKYYSKDNPFVVLAEECLTPDALVEAVEKAYWSTPLAKGKNQANSLIVESILEVMARA